MADVIEVTSRVGPGGRIVIPAPIRKRLGIETGETVVLRCTGEQVQLYSQAMAVKRLQQFVRRHVPKGLSLSEELLRERRREARGE